jgi:hypothetical protein
LLLPPIKEIISLDSSLLFIGSSSLFVENTKNQMLHLPIFNIDLYGSVTFGGA